MKWILILFLSTGEEIVYGEVEDCIINDIWNKVEIYEQEHNIDLQGWGCYDEETFLLRQNAKKNVEVDV